MWIIFVYLFIYFGFFEGSVEAVGTGGWGREGLRQARGLGWIGWVALGLDLEI